MLRTLTYVLGKGDMAVMYVEGNCGVGFLFPPSFLWGLKSECQAPLPTD